MSDASFLAAVAAVGEFLTPFPAATFTAELGEFLPPPTCGELFAAAGAGPFGVFFARGGCLGGGVPASSLAAVVLDLAALR